MPRVGWVKVVCVCVCVYVCVCECQDGGVKATRSLDDSNFGAISCGGGVFAADGLSSTHTGHTLEPVMPSPSAASAAFVAVSYPVPSIKGQQLLRLVGLHPSTPPSHHTPWGLLSWQLDRTAITATSGYGLPCGPSGTPDGHFYGQGARQPLTPGLSGVGLASPPI